MGSPFGGRKLTFLASTSLIACAVTLAPISIDYRADEPLLQVALADSGPSCFVAGTRIMMADGTEKPIEQIAVGDFVLGRGGRVNRVTGIERPRLGTRWLYAFNGGWPFVTAEHPFLTPTGWRAIDPQATAMENPRLSVGALAEGDLVAVARFDDGTATLGATALAADVAVSTEFVRLKRIESVASNPETTVYNLLLDGDHVYFADGYLVHNKGGEGGGGEGGGGEGGGGEGDAGEGGGGEGGGGEGGGGEGGGGEGGGGEDGGGEDGGGEEDGGDNDGDNSGPGSENSGSGSGNSGSGSSNSGSGSSNSGSGSSSSGSGGSSTSGQSGSGKAAKGFGAIEQSGPDLSADEEASVIDNGWQ